MYPSHSAAQAQGSDRLMPRIAAMENLTAAWKAVWVNQGSPGVDKVSVRDFDRHLKRQLAGLSEELRGNRYRPQPLMWFKRPKPNGGQRVLAVPTVRDRVAQRAFVNILGPLLERLFLDNSFGYRPGRGTREAIQQVLDYRHQGYGWLVDGDIRHCFDSIDHQLLLRLVAQHIPDPSVAAVIRLWLKEAEKVPAVSHYTGRRACGLPQGSPFSPLLCNLYLHTFDREMVRQGYRLVRYADDFVILCRSKMEAEAALLAARHRLARLRLEVNEEKTRIIPARSSLTFLGYQFNAKGAYPAAPPRPMLSGWFARVWKVFHPISKGK